MDLDKALLDIGEIRNRMAAEVLFQGFGPVSIACTGVLALLVGIAQVLMPEAPGADRLDFIRTWVGVTFVASIFIFMHMWRRARILHGTQCGVLLNRLFEQLIPAVCATMVFTWVFTRYAESAVNTLPGIWLMMASLACFSMAASLGNRMRFVGAWYLVCATAVLVVGLKQPIEIMSPWYLALPFFIGQLAMALVLRLENPPCQSAEGDVHE